MKSLTFFKKKKNGLLMQSQGLGIYSDKICADMQYCKKYHKIPYSAHLPNWSKHMGYLKKPFIGYS